MPGWPWWAARSSHLASLIANAGFHGQLDSVAVLPAALAVIVWTRGGEHRAIEAGLLLGVAASIKTVPGLFLLALLPTAINGWERAKVTLATIAVPGLVIAPFLISDPGSVIDALSYRGLPGIGGLSLVAQPSLAVAWLGRHPLALTTESDHLQSAAGALVVIGLAVTACVLFRRRTPAPEAAAAIALCLWLFGVNYALGYVIWGLPFLLLAGWVWQSVLLEALLVVPTLMLDTILRVKGYSTNQVYAFYVPSMIAVLLAYAIGWALILRRSRPPAELAPPEAAGVAL